MNSQLVISFEQKKLLEVDQPLKELPEKFLGRGETKGFSFLQIKRSNEAFIYEVSDTFGYKWYEVFKLIINGRFNKIAYPKSNAFGISAWNCKTLERAERRYSSLHTIPQIAN